MTAYVRLNAEGAIERHLDLTPEEYAALQANGKASWLRLWIVDPQPTLTATQVVELGAITITATEARQTWSVREKTALELEAESVAAERAKADEILADLTTQRAVTRTTWDAYTATQLRAEQWRDRQALLRAAHFLIRRARLQ
jgi:hypothetical protein